MIQSTNQSESWLIWLIKIVLKFEEVTKLSENTKCFIQFCRSFMVVYLKTIIVFW